MDMSCRKNSQTVFPVNIVKEEIQCLIDIHLLKVDWLKYLSETSMALEIDPYSVFKEDGKALVGGRGVLRCMFSG